MLVCVVANAYLCANIGIWSYLHDVLKVSDAAIELRVGRVVPARLRHQSQLFTGRGIYTGRGTENTLETLESRGVCMR